MNDWLVYLTLQVLFEKGSHEAANIMCPVCQNLGGSVASGLSVSPELGWL
jgi:hypothetical protein